MNENLAELLMENMFYKSIGEKIIGMVFASKDAELKQQMTILLIEMKKKFEEMKHEQKPISTDMPILPGLTR